MARRAFVFWGIIILILGACAPGNQQANNSKMKVLATTTILGDIVAQVGGGAIDLDVLLPYDVDPHAFEPSPQDMAKIAETDVVFLSGLGLESFIEPALESVSTDARIVEVSQGIPSLLEHHEDDHDHGDGVDPHVWTDPNNVIVWVENIRNVLAEEDPSNAELYRANADVYIQQLKELDRWIVKQVETIPPERRVIVTDHEIFGYFARQYGFEQIGTIIPGFSTLAQPSAQDIATLEDRIKQTGVPAVFVGNTANVSLAQRIAADTGIRVVALYTGSLSAPNGDAPTYIDYIRYNVTAIVDALK